MNPNMVRIGCHVAVLAGTMLLLMGADPSPIKANESVVFFPTFGYRAGDGQTWMVPVHGWIYQPETDSVKQRLLLGALRRSLGLDAGAEESALFKDRVRLFLVDNERDRQVSIRLGDRVQALDRSAANGHFSGTLRLGQAQAKALADKAGWLGFQASARPPDERAFHGQAQLLGKTGYSVISDVDDTIKISQVRDQRALLANTFLREFEAAPGMAELYRHWADAGASFHYVSAGPWQLYPPLADFVQKAGYPAGTFYMKDFRWKDSTFFQLFAAPDKYKPPIIRPILDALPQRKFILVGDSGELDPEVYGQLARQYPRQIVRILIRDVTAEEASAERYQKCFADVPRAAWTIFREPKELDQRVRQLKE